MNGPFAAAGDRECFGSEVQAVFSSFCSVSERQSPATDRKLRRRESLAILFVSNEENGIRDCQKLNPVAPQMTNSNRDRIRDMDDG